MPDETGRSRAHEIVLFQTRVSVSPALLWRLLRALRFIPLLRMNLLPHAPALLIVILAILSWPLQIEAIEDGVKTRLAFQAEIRALFEKGA